MVAAIIMGETVPRDKIGPESLVGNPYGPLEEHLQHTTADDDAHVEQQASPVGGDDVDHGDNPHDIPQPESKDIIKTDSEDIAQLDAPALPRLKEKEVWTIGMFKPLTMYMYVYVCMYASKLLNM
jgi:hypothetical protein